MVANTKPRQRKKEESERLRGGERSDEDVDENLRKFIVRRLIHLTDLLCILL